MLGGIYSGMGGGCLFRGVLLRLRKKLRLKKLRKKLFLIHIMKKNDPTGSSPDHHKLPLEFRSTALELIQISSAVQTRKRYFITALSGCRLEINFLYHSAI